MKLIKTISSRTLMSVLALLSFSAAANAASIRIECKVAGYSTAGWIEVRNGSNTGGRVQRDSAGRYYTDRVQRGESIRLTINPTIPGEYIAIGGAVSVKVGEPYNFDTHRQVGFFFPGPLPFSEVTSIPDNAGWSSNVFAWVIAGAPGIAFPPV